MAGLIVVMVVPRVQKLYLILFLTLNITFTKTTIQIEYMIKEIRNSEIERPRYSEFSIFTWYPNSLWEYETILSKKKIRSSNHFQTRANSVVDQSRLSVL